MSLERKAKDLPRIMNTTDDTDVFHSIHGLKSTFATKREGGNAGHYKRKMKAKTNIAAQRMSNKRAIV